VHGEHGWDIHDLDGTKWRPALLRRLHSPLIDRYIAVSKDLEHYLVRRVGIAADRIDQIYNGVDTERFAPSPDKRVAQLPAGFRGEEIIVIASVGRLQPVKDQASLLRAFAELVRGDAGFGDRLRLAIVGDGPLRGDLQRLAEILGITGLTWLPGAIENIPTVLRSFHVFVLSSLAEGISNTLLEAMASGLPVVATAAGGNTELVDDGYCGRLFSPGDVNALTRLLADYATNPSLRRMHGSAARRVAVERFGLDRMVASYLAIYENLFRDKDDGGRLAHS
jgi:sugar transferase (PEP-CTERM/EpsH1 system associated)